MNKRKNAPLGATMVVLSTVFYGSYGIWTRLMGDNFGSHMQAAFKAVIVITLLCIFGRPSQWGKIQWRRDARWFMGYLATGVLASAPIYYATNKIGIGLATVLFYAAMMLSMFFFGWLFSREPYTSVKFIATLLAFAGLYFVFASSVHTFQLLPLIAALASGAAAGLNVTISQQINYNPAQSSCIAWVTGLMTNLPLAFILHEKFPSSLHDVHWVYLLIFGIVSFMASWSVIYGLKQVEAGVTGILGILEVVFGFVFGIILFHERPASMAYVGAIFIIAAATVPYIKDSKIRKVA